MRFDQPAVSSLLPSFTWTSCGLQQSLNDAENSRATYYCQEMGLIIVLLNMYIEFYNRKQTVQNEYFSS